NWVASLSMSSRAWRLSTEVCPYAVLSFWAASSWERVCWVSVSSHDCKSSAEGYVGAILPPLTVRRRRAAPGGAENRRLPRQARGCRRDKVYWGVERGASAGHQHPDASTARHPRCAVSFLAVLGPWPTAIVLQPLLQPGWHTIVRYGTR